jgi:hypothetical protein
VVLLMEGRWVNDCQKILNEIKKSEKVEGQDRLDMVRTIRFTILALQRSVTGWMRKNNWKPRKEDREENKKRSR